MSKEKLLTSVKEEQLIEAIAYKEENNLRQAADLGNDKYQRLHIERSNDAIDTLTKEYGITDAKTDPQYTELRIKALNSEKMKELIKISENDLITGNASGLVSPLTGLKPSEKYSQAKEALYKELGVEQPKLETETMRKKPPKKTMLESLIETANYVSSKLPNIKLPNITGKSTRNSGKSGGGRS